MIAREHDAGEKFGANLLGGLDSSWVGIAQGRRDVSPIVGAII